MTRVWAVLVIQLLVSSPRSVSAASATVAVVKQAAHAKVNQTVIESVLYERSSTTTTLTTKSKSSGHSEYTDVNSGTNLDANTSADASAHANTDTTLHARANVNTNTSVLLPSGHARDEIVGSIRQKLNLNKKKYARNKGRKANSAELLKDFRALSSLVEFESLEHSPEKLLLIIINSSPLHFDLRSLVRQTWLQILKNSTYGLDQKVDYRFYISRPIQGGAKKNNEKYTEKEIKQIDSDLDDENSRFHDLAFASMRNRAWGNHYSLEYGALDLDKFRWAIDEMDLERTYRYLLLIDDDGFLCVHSLAKELDALRPINFIRGTYHCHKYTTSSHEDGDKERSNVLELTANPDDNFLLFSRDAVMKIEAAGEFLVIPTLTMGQNIATLAPVLDITLLEDDLRLLHPMIARSVQRPSFESVVRERNLCKESLWFHCSRYRGKECNNDISDFFADFVAHSTSSPSKPALLSSHHIRAGSPCWHSAAVRRAKEDRYQITLGPSDPGPEPTQGEGEGEGESESDRSQDQSSKMRVMKKEQGKDAGVEMEMEMEVEVQVVTEMDKTWQSRLVARANNQWI